MEVSGFALPARLGSCLLACAVNIFDVPMQFEHKADLAVDMSEFLIVTLHGFEHAQRWRITSILLRDTTVLQALTRRHARVPVSLLALP